MSIKIFLKLIIGILAILIFILLGLYWIPPAQATYEYQYGTYPGTPEEAEKVGWYQDEDGKEYQITWATKGGLLLNHFDTVRSELLNIHLIKEGSNSVFTDKKGSGHSIKLFRDIEEKILLQGKIGDKKLAAEKVDSMHYSQEEIQYTNADIRLVGTLFKPFKASKKIVLVFIHGSGISNRDNFWYMCQADYLARKGYTVLLPDKRGCGKSHGEWHVASFDEFADDIVSGIDYLIESKGLDDYKIGVLGLSQGGWISHVVADKYVGLDFVIDVVSSATTPAEQLHFEIKRDMEDGGAPGFISGNLSTVFSKRAMGRRKIWWGHNGDYDPITMIKDTRVPILKIFGSEDENVPVKESLKNLELLNNEYPDLPLTIKVFQGSGHALFNVETDWIRNDYLELVDAWIQDLSN